MLSRVVERNVKHFPFLQIHFATGVVTSPNYPGNYPNNLEKTETIQVEEGLIISLHFNAFHIQSQTTCGYDHLTITDGDGTTLMEKSCGIIYYYTTMPADIRSTSNIVKLVFITDRTTSKTGWSVSWSAVSPGECQQHLLNPNWMFLFLFSIQPECPPLPPPPSHLCVAPAGTLNCHYTGDHCCCGNCSESFKLSCAPDSTTGAGVWQSTLCPAAGCGSEGEWWR